MAHFAKLNSENIVTQVLVLSNDVLRDSNNIEQEALGIEFLTKMTNHSLWKQTSYNSNFRKRFAGVGHTYDPQRDAFIPPKEFPSFIFNEEACMFKAPITRPNNLDYQGISINLIWDEDNIRWLGEDTDNNRYIWNPNTLSWSINN